MSHGLDHFYGLLFFHFISVQIIPLVQHSSGDSSAAGFCSAWRAGLLPCVQSQTWVFSHSKCVAHSLGDSTSTRERDVLLQVLCGESVTGDLAWVRTLFVQH